MKILALEFSSSQRSVALVESAAAATGATPGPLEVAKGAPSGPIATNRRLAGHGGGGDSGGDAPPRVLGCVAESAPRHTDAMGLIERVLGQAGVEREQVNCVAVGLGPGSYTGIRAAIAVAQGWQLATSARLLGLGGVECLAVQAQAAGWFGRLGFTIDAQRDEFCLAVYQIGPTASQLIEAFQLVSREEVLALQRNGALIVGPEVSRWFSEGRDLFPSAATLGQLAASRSDFSPGEQLQPIYLRQVSFVKAPPPRVLP